ncbi:anti-toxin [Luteolibacter sp. Populi]|uniref:type II toxin-antitoxin system RelB family antitoxin n=1 Tax=Luteolibacter sp. Populi TaxID=3230487 RepID=UPI0034663716
MIAIDLDPDIERRLALLAEKSGQTKDFHAKEAILEHIEDLEDEYEALERLQNPGPTFSAEEAKRELGL